MPTSLERTWPTRPSPPGRHHRLPNTDSDFTASGHFFEIRRLHVHHFHEHVPAAAIRNFSRRIWEVPLEVRAIPIGCRIYRDTVSKRDRVELTHIPVVATNNGGRYEHHSSLSDLFYVVFRKIASADV